MSDFTFVTARVATGAAITDESDVEALAAAGVTHVVDARAELDDAPLLAGRFAYLWNPTQDDGQPKPVDYWQKTLAFSLPVFQQPKTRLYLHCAAGINRGPSNAYCVLVALGFSSTFVLTLIRQARPVTVNGIRYAPDALAAIQALGYA